MVELIGPECRQAKVEDADAIAALTQELGYSTTSSQTAEILTKLLVSTNHGVFVALTQQHVCAWLVVEKRITLETGVKAEITGLVVSKQARRQGLGEALVRMAEEWSRERGIKHLVVRSNTRREASHHFYPSVGFEPTKTSQVYVKSLGLNSGG